MTTTQVLTREVTVGCEPERAFAIFTDRITDWWPLHTHSVSLRRHGAPAVAVAFADGRLFETAPNGEKHTWGEVVVWEPPHRLAYTWRISREDDLHTDVEVTFTAVAEGTRVVVEHSGWEIWAERAEEVRTSYHDGWDMVLAAYVEAT